MIEINGHLIPGPIIFRKAKTRAEYNQVGGRSFVGTSGWRRRHGPGSLYASNYPDAHLKRDAQKMRAWLSEGKDVYIYYNNDAYGYAVKNGLTLKEFLDKT